MELPSLTSDMPPKVPEILPEVIPFHPATQRNNVLTQHLLPPPPALIWGELGATLFNPRLWVPIPPVLGQHENLGFRRSGKLLSNSARLCWLQAGPLMPSDSTALTGRELLGAELLSSHHEHSTQQSPGQCLAWAGTTHTPPCSCSAQRLPTSTL